MAKRKLNKKVAISGIIILTIIAAVAVAGLVLRQKGRNPDKLLRHANERLGEIETQLTQYREMLTDPDRQQETEQLLEAGRQAYADVFRKYGRAAGFAKDDARKLEILFQLADLRHETNNEFYTPNWEQIFRVWYSITSLDPKNVAAKMKLLHYFYDMAHAGNTMAWTQVKEQVSGTESDGSDGLIQIMASQNKQPEPFILIAKARAALELAASGQATDLVASLDEAIGDFETLLEQTPEDVDIYVYLARAFTERGKIRNAAGYDNAVEEAEQQAKDTLQKAVEVLPENPHANINLLEKRLTDTQHDEQQVQNDINNRRSMLQVATQRGDKEQVQAIEDEVQALENGLQTIKEDFRILELDFKALVTKFDSIAAAHASLSKFYLLSNQFDKAIDAMELAMKLGKQETESHKQKMKSHKQKMESDKQDMELRKQYIELNKQNMEYALLAANLHYVRSFRTEDMQFKASIDILNAALKLPDAQDVSGPRSHANRINRLTLHSFLARIYVEQSLQALQDDDSEENRLLVAKAEQNIHEITQFYRSSTNIYVIMWAGILDLARGHNEKAIRQMYDAYEQFEAARRPDQRPGREQTYLSYMLAEAFSNRPEIGSRLNFLRNAIVGGIARTQPQSLLDYAELLLKVQEWSNAISLSQACEQIASPNQRSRSIQVAAYVGLGQFDEAAGILGAMEPDDHQTIDLRFSLAHVQTTRMARLQMQDPLTSEEQEQLDQYRSQRAELLDELINTHSEQVAPGVVIIVCRDYLTQDKPDHAKVLVEKYLAHNTDNLNALIFQRSLLEPEPLNIPSDRLNAITLEVTSKISDPQRRAVSLGRYHMSLGQYTLATDEYKKALDIAPDNKQAISGLFDTAILQKDKDFELADQMAQKARQYNLDECEGNFYLATLSLARADYNQALERVQLCLKIRPVYAGAYYLRSRINNAMGNFAEAIKDAQTAAEMNPLDISIARQRVHILHERNTRQKQGLSTEQRLETEQALRRAIALNTNDWYSRSLYARYRSVQHPDEALAVFQLLQERVPNVTNHLLLANLAMQMSRKELDDKKEASFLEMASSAYEKAFALEPDNKTVQSLYSEFLRLTDQQDKVETIFAKKDDVLWQFYLRDGRHKKAALVLAKLHEQDPKNLVVLGGLASVARLTGDKDGVRTYCEKILEIENTIDNQLFQVEMYLETGLIKEAELKLASFRERNPQELRGLLLNAWVAKLKGELEKALSLVNRYLELDTENAIALRLRGNIYRLRHEYDKAVEYLQKSKNLNPNATISLELADAYRRTGKMTQAIGELKSAIKDPMAPVRLRTTLESLYKEDGQKTALRAFYDECIAKYPDLELWYYRAAQFYLSEKDLQKAEGLLRQAWEIAEKEDEPSDIIFDLYLETLWKQGQFESVLSLASKYIDTPGLGSVAYAQMGQSHAKMGNAELAVQHYRKALGKCGDNDQLIIGTLRNMMQTVGVSEIHKWVDSELQGAPDSISANIIAFHLADVSGQFNKAIQHIEKCMAVIGPDEPMYSRYSTFKARSLVKAYLKTSDKDYLLQAIEQYRKILDDQPLNLQALNNLAFLLADNNEQLDKAEEYGARALAGSPNNPNIMDTYAYTLCKRGKFTKAEELLQTTIQLYEVQGTPMPWEVYRNLGMAQEGLEQNELAAASYKQATEIGGDAIAPKDKAQLTQAIERVSQ